MLIVLVNWWMNWKEGVLANPRYNTGTVVEGQTKTAKYIE
jgi:hypothetical protein